MLNTYTVAFFGHRRIDDAARVSEWLENYIQGILKEKEFVEFLVGRNGEFDCCVASAMRRIQKNYREDNSSLVLGLPYLTAEYRENSAAIEEYYGSVEISFAASGAHPKAAIQIRNREMVDRADCIVCFVEHAGGAQQTMQYAVKKQKPIINLAPRISYP